MSKQLIRHNSDTTLVGSINGAKLYFLAGKDTPIEATKQEAESLCADFNSANGGKYKMEVVGEVTDDAVVPIESDELVTPVEE